MPHNVRRAPMNGIPDATQVRHSGTHIASDGINDVRVFQASAQQFTTQAPGAQLKHDQQGGYNAVYNDAQRIEVAPDKITIIPNNGDVQWEPIESKQFATKYKDGVTLEDGTRINANISRNGEFEAVAITNQNGEGWLFGFPDGKMVVVPYPPEHT